MKLGERLCFAGVAAALKAPQRRRMAANEPAIRFNGRLASGRSRLEPTSRQQFDRLKIAEGKRERSEQKVAIDWDSSLLAGILLAPRE